MSKSPTFGNLVSSRGFSERRSPKAVSTIVKKHLRSLSRCLQAAESAGSRSSSTSRASPHNTIHANDFKFYEELNEFVQARAGNERWTRRSLGRARFDRHREGQALHTRCADEEDPHRGGRGGQCDRRAIIFKPRRQGRIFYYPDRLEVAELRCSSAVTSSFQQPMACAVLGLAQQLMRLYLLSRASPPAMCMRLMIGRARSTPTRSVDSEGKPLRWRQDLQGHAAAEHSGARASGRSRSTTTRRARMLDTTQQYPRASAARVIQSPVSKPECRWIVLRSCFRPRSRQAVKRNWIQTMPGKGWFPILRFYSPLEPWFDKTWRPGEIELVK